jgi:hypothetical protein
MKMARKIQFWREVNANGVIGRAVLKTIAVPEAVPIKDAVDAAIGAFCAEMKISDWSCLAHGYELQEEAGSPQPSHLALRQAREAKDSAIPPVRTFSVGRLMKARNSACCCTGEPSWRELLTDPIIGALMRRDGMEPADVEAQMADIRGKLRGRSPFHLNEAL